MLQRELFQPVLAGMAACALIGSLALAWAQAPVRQEIQGTAGGTVRATQWGVTSTGPCMGWVPQRPHHHFTLAADAEVTIRVRSHTDTTLVLRSKGHTPQLTFCNDDADGNNPGIQQKLPAGDYEIYVGTWDAGDRVPFSLTLF